MKVSGSSFILLAVSASLSLAAECPCGYKDPVTGALWTDSIITYFNETDADTSVLLDPQHKTSFDGGKSGNNQDGSSAQVWTVANALNDYNDGFSSLWRTGYAPNNTVLPADDAGEREGGIQFDVQPADKSNRITWGSGLLTRRRDIQFGSFRASMIGPRPYQGGTILQFGVQHNSSEYIRSSIYSASDDFSQSTLQWGYSARNTDAEPYTQNLTQALGPSPWSNYVEHRIDWLGPQQLTFSNNATLSLDSVSQLNINKKLDKTNLPTLGGPISLSHYSAGDTSLNQSPPVYHQPSARVIYARLFFNSSSAQRHDSFEAGCSAAANTNICNTEDQKLRESTPFDPDALLAVVPPTSHRHIPLYSIVVCSAAGGLFVLLLVHALSVRSIRSHQAAKAAVRETADDGAESTELGWEYTDGKTSSAFGAGRISTDPARWEDPDFLASALQDWDADDADRDSLDGSTLDEDEYDCYDDPLGLNHKENLSDAGCRDSYPSHLQASGSAHSFNTLPQKFAHSETHSLSDSSHQLQVLSYVRSHTHEQHRSGADSDDGFTDLSHHLGSFSGDLPAARRAAFGGGGPAGVGAMQTSPSQARWSAPIVEWEPAPKTDSEQTDDAQMAQRKDTPHPGARPAMSSFAAKKQRLSQVLFGTGNTGQTASGAARVEYLDGLRGFACFLVSLHHFLLIFYGGITTAGQPLHYPGMETWLRKILGPIIANGGLNVGIFFCLAARVIANRYLVRGRLQDLAEAIHRRVPRLMLPISAAIVINYFLIEADAFHWVQRLASRTWSAWSYYEDYQNLGVFINDYLTLWFTIPPTVPALVSLYATGILWTVPIIVQSSWTVFLCALIAREMPNPKKRYPFYAACWGLSWYANRFDYFFLAGLIIADLDNRLRYRQKAVKGFSLVPASLQKHLPTRIASIRVHGQVFAWVIFLTGATFAWLDNNGDFGSDVVTGEHDIHPSLSSALPNAWNTATSGTPYTDPKFFDFLFVIGFFLLCDLCSSFRTFFQLRFWSSFGRNAFSLYLLHGVIFWSWGSWLCIKLLSADVPYWAAILVVFLTSYFWLAIVCEIFTRTFDAWGVGISKSFWRATSDGLGRRG
ncbi:unnamed protein product [Sympodiomycopsis kandeliae]